MGQYWKVVNLDKKEFVSPYRVGCGAKLWEHLANHPATGGALLILCAAMPEARGGGDFDLDKNWHGPERVDMTCAGQMPTDYPSIAKRTIGRWAGDRIALIGDYAEDGDLRNSPVPASEIYGLCQTKDGIDEQDALTPGEWWTDVSADVAAVIEHELGGKFEGDGGFCQWKPKELVPEVQRARKTS